MRPLATRALSLAVVAFTAACDVPQDLFPLTATALAAESTPGAHADKPAIVLVHGAFADGSGWQDVIPILQQRGHVVVAAQNPLQTLAGDIAATRRVIDALPGNVVVVGHSYGGAVISGAAAGSPKVKALVYVAAYALDAGESVGSLNGLFPKTSLEASIVPDAAGFVLIRPDKYRDVFAADLPERQTRVLAATQKPTSFATLSETLGGAGAWRLIPSWYIVAENDRTINPDLERFLAKRMGARTTELRTSHVPFLSRPQEVARVILEAADASAR